jgi:hypothetical protein
MRFIAFILVILCAGAAHAEWKKVAKTESNLLLVLPFLESGREIFQDGGWNAQASTRTAYAAVVPVSGAFPRAQVYSTEIAPLYNWRMGIVLDAAWIKDKFPFFKDKDVQITIPAPSTDAYVRRVQFTVGAATCVGFDLRQAGVTAAFNSTESLQSVSGIYCPPAGTALTDELFQRVVEGIFVRRNGKVERAVTGTNKPLPAELM